LTTLKTLANMADRADIQRRIAALKPGSPRQWGTMSIGGMLCHLDDSYRAGLREKTIATVSVPMPRPIIKFIALQLPIAWPKNMMSTEEVKQGCGGTPPGDFAHDQARLLETLERFCNSNTLSQVRHPFFGSMSRNNWLRWGYLHADHHLRQFSA
jgi:hypothetical protein